MFISTQSSNFTKMRIRKCVLKPYRQSERVEETTADKRHQQIFERWKTQEGISRAEKTEH